MSRTAFFRWWATAPLIAALAACVDHPSQPVLAPSLSTQGLTVTSGQPTVLFGFTPPLGLPAPSPTASGLGILANTTFLRFARSPAEGGGFVEMPVGGNAYFRDVAFAAEASLHGDAAGDYWESDIVFPGGGGLTFPRVTYQGVVNGEDCWTIGFQSLCGLGDLWVADILGIQCLPGGLYTYHLKENGGLAFQGSFTLKQMLPPGTVPSLYQGDYPDQLDSVCQDADGKTIPCTGAGDDVPQTIANRGCAVTAAAMLLQYWGMSVDPVSLNDSLVALDHGGFDEDGNIFWPGLLIPAARDGHYLDFHSDATVTPAGLRNLICRSGPQIVYVKNRKHFVVVTGLTDDGTDFRIANPAGRLAPTVLSQYGGFRSVRKFEPLSQPTFADVLAAMLDSPGELVITDPLGRRTGFDPTRGRTFGEIPDASYDSTGLAQRLDDTTLVDLDPAAKELYVYQPVDGDYTVTVTGTGNGTYTLHLVGYDVQQRFSSFVAEDIPISVGEVHQYALRFSGADMSSGDLTMMGGFDGGGQRSDVNHLLSYARPGASRTTLAAGTSTYSLFVFYDPAIDPASFQAELNGAVATGLFHPAPGGSEVLSLPLQPGRNVLKLAITGSPGGRAGTDRDQLTFLVP